MPNPFNTQNINPNFQLQNFYKMLTQSKNPLQMFEQIASNNPNLKPITNMLKNNNPQDVFKSLCKERGINPDEFIKSITG